MQITHEEAHKLIQFRADGALKLHERHLLASHLETCADCQQYATGIGKVETVLRPLLGRQWNSEHLPLSIELLRRKERSASERMLVASRVAAFAVVFVAFFFGAWNFTVYSHRSPAPFEPGVPLIPTPFTSTVTAGTEVSFKSCAMIPYVVQPNDTLARIAYQFSVPVDQVLQINSMRGTTLITGETLLIPACTSTATNTAAARTTTFTPAHYSTTTTPDG